MRVRDILKDKSGHVVAISPEAPLTSAARLMYENGIGAIIVATQGGRMLGLLSERDLVRAAAEFAIEITTMKVEEIFTKRVTTCGLDTSLEEVMQVMHEHRFRHMPVIEHGGLKGIVSIGDVFKYLLDQAGESEEAMLWAGTTDLL